MKPLYLTNCLSIINHLAIFVRLLLTCSLFQIFAQRWLGMPSRSRLLILYVIHYRRLFVPASLSLLYTEFWKYISFLLENIFLCRLNENWTGIALNLLFSCGAFTRMSVGCFCDCAKRWRHIRHHHRMRKRTLNLN